MTVKDNEYSLCDIMSERSPISMLRSETSWPGLPYNLREHRPGIAIAIGLITFTSVFLNLALFYGLWYGSNLKHNIVVAIPVAIFGATTIPQFFVRLWKLCRKNSQSRPIGASRFALDFFQYGYLIGIVIITVEEVVGTIPKEPRLRLLSMPASSLMFELATLMAISIIWNSFNLKAPIRFSSCPGGQVPRPGVYIIVEDVVAVDGGAGEGYRKALNARYEASPEFRRLMMQMTIFWTVGLYLFGAVTTAIVFTVKREVAYGIGWALPFVLVACMTIFTIKYVQRASAKEHALLDVVHQGV